MFSLSKIPGALILAVLAGSGAAWAQTFFGAYYNGPMGQANLYTISPVNSSAALIGPMHAETVSAMAFALDRTTLYAIGQTNSTGFALLRVSIATGAGTVVGPTGLFAPCQDMDFRPSDGTLFAYCEGRIFTVALATGMATFLGDTGKFPNGNALAFSSSNILYNANESTLDIINQSDGSVTSNIPLNYNPAFGGGARANAMKFHPNGTLYASIVGSGQTGQKWSLGIINTSTGVVTFVGAMVQGTDALAIGNAGLGPSATPVPSSWLLVTIGILCAALYQKMRRGERPLGPVSRLR
jgi:hypothetical protein